MIRVTLEKQDNKISFDIDMNFRTAILGENGIGKTSILKSIVAKASKDDWLSVAVPESVTVAYLSQIEPNLTTLSGGEHTKERLMKLFSEKADLYILDEPTNNLDEQNIEWLKDHILKNKLPIIFTSHDIDFIDHIAEVIFYLDSKGVDKTKEKCSSYLVTRKKRVEREFSLYDIAVKKQKELFEAARNVKQHSDAGAKWKGSDNDTFLRGFNRNKAGKSGVLAGRLKDRAEDMEVEKPKFDPLPKVILSSSITSNFIFSLSTSTLSQKRISLSQKSGDKLLVVGKNGVGKTMLMKYLVKLLENGNPQKDDEFSRGGKFSYMYLAQDWYEHLDDTKVADYLETFGLEGNDIYKSLSFNHLDKNILEKKFKELSPGVRIKVLLGALSCRSFDLIIWDEPTNHLDVMTQYVLHDAFLQYPGALILVSHDKLFLEDKKFTAVVL
jgi:macrolide transport system ATP-binding/permease protein